MLFLVKDILDYSQIESQSLILNKALVSIKSILDECLSVLMFKAQEKGIELSLIEGPANSISIVTDGNRVKQIIINLLSNAIKYTVQGYVRITVETGKITKLDGTGADGNATEVVKIKVEDSGVGMSKQQKARLFQPFTKIKSNRQLNKEGVGLGLAVSKNMAIALSGDIECIS